MEGDKSDGVSGVFHSDSQSPPLGKYETNASIMIPKDVFEKMYLTPKLPVKGHLRDTFGNPTPL